MPNLISRKEAHAQGLKRFFTGKPCKRNHISERNVKTGACLGCLAHYSKEYSAKYAGATGLTLRVDPAHVPLIESFASLLAVLKARGEQMPIVPWPDEVANINTLIKMSRPVEIVHAPAPTPASVDPAAKLAMWTRIHGAEIANQMMESEK
jgi:hypothetical protein